MPRGSEGPTPVLERNLNHLCHFAHIKYNKTRDIFQRNSKKYILNKIGGIVFTYHKIMLQNFFIPVFIHKFDSYIDAMISDINT